MKPITPKQALNLKQESIPDFVFEAFNQLITENISNGRASVKQKDVVSRIKQLKSAAFEDIDSQFIYSRGWLDVEPHYRKAGWKVEYDKPGYNESYDAYFVFTGSKG